MDPVSEVLNGVRSCSSVFFRAELSSPWALESPGRELLAGTVMPQAEHVALFHTVVQGQCLAACGGHQRIGLEAGDILLVPRGQACTIRSDVRAWPIPFDRVLAQLSPDALPQLAFGGDGRTVRFLCGYLTGLQQLAPLFDPA